MKFQVKKRVRNLVFQLVEVYRRCEKVAEKETALEYNLYPKRVSLLLIVAKAQIAGCL